MECFVLGFKSILPSTVFSSASVAFDNVGPNYDMTKHWNVLCKNAKGGNFWKTVKEILKIILLFLELDII